MIALHHFLILSWLLSAPAVAWSPSFSMRQIFGKRSRAVSSRTQEQTQVETRVSTDTVADQVLGRLYYRSGEEIDELVVRPRLVDDTVALPSSAALSSVVGRSSDIRSTTKEPRPMDLPRHSPPKDVIQGRKLLLDMEMTMGRLTMITAMILFAGEIVTGSSMLDLVQGFQL
jgi:hypothetical protein